MGHGGPPVGLHCSRDGPQGEGAAEREEKTAPRGRCENPHAAGNATAPHRSGPYGQYGAERYGADETGTRDG
ncbi:hypothetical protein DA2_2639 [Desulfovibrio sp. A2]|nr:hypothetical protein DA2_2639 [Desulfovibrio sp. A2]